MTSSRNDRPPGKPTPIADYIYMGEVGGADASKAVDRFKAAHTAAFDTRKFEIELYWKRATYFWALIAATLVAYGTVVSKSGPHLSYGTLEVLSALGFFFATALWYVNRGSRFWQNNWERHVDLLEEQVNGPLYKTVFLNAIESKRFFGAKGYSVTRLSQMVVLPVLGVWFLLLLNAAVHLSPHAHRFAHRQFMEHVWLYDILAGSGVAISVIGFLWFQRTGLNRAQRGSPADYTGLVRRP